MKKPETKHVIVLVGSRIRLELDTQVGTYRAYHRVPTGWVQRSPDAFGTETKQLFDNLSFSTRKV